MRIGPFEITVHIKRVAPKKHDSCYAEIDRLVLLGRGVEAMRYYRANVRNNYYIAKEYVAARAKRLGISDIPLALR